jgi:transcriptional regulator with XRE-family HTH domain
VERGVANMKRNRVELQTRKNEIERQIDSLEAEIGNCQLQQQHANIKAEKITYISKESECREEITKLKQELANIDFELRKLKRFNRDVCLENIDYLLAQKGIKLGELEMDSGNRPGYLSRMKSGKSTSDPSIEFLMTASEQLDVPLDMLVSSKVSELTPTEEFILNFLKKVIQDTECDRLVWERESVDELEKLEIYTDNQGYSSVPHPLYSVREERTEDNYNEYPVYESLFFKGCGVKPCNNCYHTRLVPTDQWLYAMECKKGDEGISRKEDGFFEFYLVSYVGFGDTITKKLCNTLNVSSPIRATINSLIKQIIVSLSHIHIEDMVKEAIDAYMNGIAPCPDDDALPFN